MTHYQASVPEPAPYRARVRTALRIPLIMTGFFALVATSFTILMHTPFLRFFVLLLDVIVFVLAIVLQIKWAKKEERYFMTFIGMEPDQVQIAFMDTETPKQVYGRPDEFEFKKKEVLGRTGSSYQQSDLEIYYHGKPLLRQYVSENWTDRKFIEIVHAAAN